MAVAVEAAGSLDTCSFPRGRWAPRDPNESPTPGLSSPALTSPSKNRELCLDWIFSDSKGFSFDSGQVQGQCRCPQSHEGQHGAPQAVVAEASREYNGQAEESSQGDHHAVA